MAKSRNLVFMNHQNKTAKALGFAAPNAWLEDRLQQAARQPHEEFLFLKKVQTAAAEEPKFYDRCDPEDELSEDDNATRPMAELLERLLLSRKQVRTQS